MSKRLRRIRKRLGIVEAVAAAGLLVLWLTGANTPPGAGLAERWRRVAAMSAGERAQLENNFELWEKLSPDRRQYFREMHATLEREPQLRKVMNTYAAWLNTLSPGQRDDLRKEANPTKRLAMVKELRREQEEEAESRATGSWGWRNRPRFNFAPLGRDDLAAVMRVLHDSFTPPDFREPINEQTPKFVRYRIILGAVGDRIRRIANWPAAELTDKIAAAISDDSQRKFLQSREDGRDLRIGLWNLLTKSILHQTQEVLEAHRPTDAELLSYWENLSSTERDSIMSEPARYRQHVLFHQYLRDKRASESPELAAALELRKFLVKMWGSMFRGFENGPRGPRGGRRRNGRPSQDE